MNPLYKGNLKHYLLIIVNENGVTGVFISNCKSIYFTSVYVIFIYE